MPPQVPLERDADAQRAAKTHTGLSPERELPRISRRLHSLRGWSNEKVEVFP